MMRGCFVLEGALFCCYFMFDALCQNEDLDISEAKLISE